MFFAATHKALPTAGLLDLVCHQAISPSVPHKVSRSHGKEAAHIWMISKGKNFLTLECGDVSFSRDLQGWQLVEIVFDFK